MSEEGKDVQKVYNKLELDISDMDLRGRVILGRYIENYEGLDLSSCVFYGCFPSQIENGICIKPETLPENLLLNGSDFSGLDLKGLVLLTGSEIRDVDFSASKLNGARLEDLEVHDSSFRHISTYLGKGIKIIDCTFTNCDFYFSSFTSSTLSFDANNCDFSKNNFEYTLLLEVRFKNCNLEYSVFGDSAWSSSFEDCNLGNTVFKGLSGFPNISNCEMSGVEFVRMDLVGEPDVYYTLPENLEDILFNGNFEFVDFSNSNLKGAVFKNSTYLKHVSFENADLEGAHFYGVTFEGHVSFKNANLRDVTFRRCENLYNVDFEGADLSNVDYDKKDTRYFVDFDFSGKSLVGEDFSNEDILWLEYIFTEADLEDADFRNSYLVGVDFENANLKNANFQGATLTRCNLKNTNLENANLEFTNLEWADMKGSDVSFANFTLAKYNSGTILPDSILQSQIDSMTLTDAHEPRENSSLSESVVNDIVTVFESYESKVDMGFGGLCVAAAETVFEDVLEHGNLKHPERLEIVAVWNTFCLENGKPVGHVCLRYFVGEDREDPEAYVYIDSDLYEKEYHEVEAWGHMPEYMLDTAFDLEKDASILEGYEDDDEFETTTLSFSNIEDFKNSPSYRMYCNVPL